MNEKAVNVADKPEKKRKKIGKYDVIILLIGIGLMVAGIAGIVTSLAAADDYDNSTDIRKFHRHPDGGRRDRNNRTQRRSHWGKVQGQQ